MEKFDFSGWATRNNLKCSDGRIILKDAFQNDDGSTVPLVWNHQHNDPLNVLGHALLENREEGVYAYCVLNDTESGKNAKLLVEHGDVSALSIFANQLKQQGPNVTHGAIREVSLVLAGANPGAFIDSVMSHGEKSEDEAIIYTGEDISLSHADDKNEKETVKEEKAKSEDEETVEEVFNTLTEKQKLVCYAMLGMALNEQDQPEDNTQKKSKGDEIMKHNVFNTADDKKQEVLSHADIETIFSDVKRYGSLKESVLAHGITNIDYMFPDAQNVVNEPLFIKRDQGWVTDVMNRVHHTPFSRIKSIFANLTEDEARAKGYIKGKLKAEEVFALLKRSTAPATIYKKQKLDRDDIVDITDFDVVMWMKKEMRFMLDEEIARAILIGDGRPASSDIKIQEQNIRPIWTDEDLYSVKQEIEVAAADTQDHKTKLFVQAAVKSRKNYKGSGNPVLYTTEDVLTDCLLMEDTTGRVIYDTIEKLATALRVKEIITVPVMENKTRTGSDNKVRTLLGIIVNLNDYIVGADKGGAVNLFDDFDIDYNAQKYLIETRCSGALTVPYSAIVLEQITKTP